MEKSGLLHTDRVLVVGASGFVGKRLIPELIKKTITLRLLARDPAKVAAMKNSGGDIEIIQGDLLSGEGIEDALHGIRTAFYLVHSMGGKSIFRNTEYAERTSRLQEILYQRQTRQDWRGSFTSAHWVKEATTFQSISEAVQR